VWRVLLPLLSGHDAQQRARSAARLERLAGGSDSAELRSFTRSTAALLAGTGALIFFAFALAGIVVAALGANGAGLTILYAGFAVGAVPMCGGLLTIVFGRRLCSASVQQRARLGQVGAVFTLVLAVGLTVALVADTWSS
jgi:hypothetical protein